MTTQINSTIFQFGRVDAQFFERDCQAGDWRIWDIAFPTAFPHDGVRVIVTPNDLRVDTGVHSVAAVGLAQDVTRTGFRLAARNSDCSSGSAGFDWMAVLETPGQQIQRPVSLRVGVVQQKWFNADCVPGDWQHWDVIYRTPFPKTPVVLLTASNLNIQGNNAAVVGTSRDSTGASFTLAARNSDCQPGDCAFYHLALSPPEGEGRTDLFVDTGEVPARTLHRDCHPGDWDSGDIYFSRSFLTSPFVFLTANNKGVVSKNAAVVGIARNVTTHGFTLAARNSDCSIGEAGFYWVAIGCALGCG